MGGRCLQPQLIVLIESRMTATQTKINQKKHDSQVGEVPSDDAARVTDRIA